MERTAGAEIAVPNAIPQRLDATGEVGTARRAATAAVFAAVLLGMLGDALFRAPRPGINLLLWVVAALAGAAWVARVRQRPTSPGAWALAVPVMFFASAFAWRAADELLALNVLAMLSAFGLLALAVSGWPASITRASLGELLLGGASVGFSGAVGTPMLIVSDRALADGGARPRGRTALAIARGILIALPVLLVFGALLSSADPRFERLIATLFDVDFGATIGHIVFAGFIAWVAAGYLRAAVAERPLGVSQNWRGRGLSLGLTEVATVLGLVDGLFALFVALQLPHLFGGAGRVQRVPGLTMAEYARGGFFELVTVAALVLPLLLAAAALVRRTVARDWRVFRALAIGMLVLLGMMIVSALQRLMLYVDTFGLTTDRIYATAMVVWLTIVFLLFIGIVLRQRQAGFAFAAIVSGWMVLAALDVVNPEALVVSTNAERATLGADFDGEYASSLSADAVPALANALDRVDAVARCRIAARLKLVVADRDEGIPTDWRSWNASRTRAFSTARGVDAAGILARCPKKVVASP